VLITKWVAQAWERVSNNPDVIIRAFEKCGIALPIDGSHDDKIHIKGLEGYRVNVVDMEDEVGAEETIALDEIVVEFD
jgi:hypothetical protein